RIMSFPSGRTLTFCSRTLPLRSNCRSSSFTVLSTAEIYTLSLHDALPISLDMDGALEVQAGSLFLNAAAGTDTGSFTVDSLATLDRKSTRLNSSHQIISYAVSCLIK